MPPICVRVRVGAYDDIQPGHMLRLQEIVDAVGHIRRTGVHQLVFPDGLRRNMLSPALRPARTHQHSRRAGLGGDGRMPGARRLRCRRIQRVERVKHIGGITLK